MLNIPKRMSFFWGGGPLSFLRYMAFWSFRKMNPTWDIYLYLAPACQNRKTWKTDELIDAAADGGRGILQDHLPKLAALGVKIEGWTPPPEFRNASPVHMADLCRWGVLSQFGGWFADTDFLFVDWMNIVEGMACDKEKELSAGETFDPDVALCLCRDWLPTGIMGAKPGNDFSAKCYMAARQSADFGRFKSAGAETIGRLAGFDPTYPPDRRLQFAALKSAFPGVNFWNVLHTVFYRWEWHEAADVFNRDDPIFPHTVGIHWSGSMRAAQRFNLKYLNEAAMANDAGAYAQHARNVLGLHPAGA